MRTLIALTLLAALSSAHAESSAAMRDRLVKMQEEYAELVADIEKKEDLIRETIVAEGRITRPVKKDQAELRVMEQRRDSMKVQIEVLTDKIAKAQTSTPPAGSNPTTSSADHRLAALVDQLDEAERNFRQAATERQAAREALRDAAHDAVKNFAEKLDRSPVFAQPKPSMSAAERQRFAADLAQLNNCLRNIDKQLGPEDQGWGRDLPHWVTNLENVWSIYVEARPTKAQIPTAALEAIERAN